jgi:hypothetical protein
VEFGHSHEHARGRRQVEVQAVEIPQAGADAEAARLVFPDGDPERRRLGGRDRLQARRRDDPQIPRFS